MPPAPVLDATLPHLLIGVESKREFRRVEGGIALPKAVGGITRTSVPASTVEMEDLVHDLPLAIQFQQREHVRKA